LNKGIDLKVGTMATKENNRTNGRKSWMLNKSKY